MTLQKTEPISAPHAIVLFLFLFSGVSGLIYEVLWTRMFTLVLGTTVYAVATVLGVYMGGLALGSWLFGRIADRPGRNGFRIYAWLEGLVGLYAFLLPLLMSLSDDIYRMAWPSISESFSGQMALRLVLAILILIVPTTLMGGTLPVLSRYLVRRIDRSGTEIGTLYAVNTLGAVVGCFITGFFLIEHLGVRMTLFTAAVLNLAVAVLALYFSGRTRPAGQETRPAEPEIRPAKPSKKNRSSRARKNAQGPADYTPGQVKAVLWLFALSGFTALALEVLWTRSLMYFVNIDTWAFTSMLCAFLCGIGLGSLVMSRIVDRIRNPLATLAVIEILIGVTAGFSIPLFGLLYGTQTSEVWEVFSSNPLLTQITHKLFHSFFIMLVPTLLMGAAFPLVCRIYVGARKEVGRGTGTLYALNTVGAILGSVGAGFIMLPLLGGIQDSILFAASLYALIGLLLLVVAAKTKKARSRFLPIGAAGLALLVFANFGFTGRPVILLSHFFKSRPGTFTLRYFHEGPDASIAVLEKKNGLRELNINGQSTAFDNYMDMQVHRMLSHLPILVHRDPKEVLVVGFGMGSTVWGCCQHEGVERVDVVELLRAEKETAPWFEAINHGVLGHPKLKFIQGDGRNYLLGTREKYDVISFNAIHPRYSANLYTVDFYRMCREKMSPDGILCAWLTQNALVDVEWRMLCRSLTEVFLERRPDHPMALCDMGRIAMEKGDFEKAEELLLRSLSVRREAPETMLQLGLLRFFQGRLEESAGILQNILKTAPDAPPIVAYVYFEILVRLGMDCDNAANEKDKISSRIPGIDRYFELLEKTVRMMRDKKSARK